MSTKKAEARERVKAMREEQARKDRARERMMRLGVIAAVLVGVLIIAIAVISNRGGGDDGPVAVPADSLGEGEGIMIGDADAPVTIENWMDFLCPHCQSFEQQNGELIDQWVESGDVNVINYPVTYTGGAYSARANNALACAADRGMADEFFDAVFAAGSQQWSNRQLVNLGDDLGIGDGFGSCVNEGTYSSWVASVTDAARENGIEGTPTVFVNGEQVADWSPGGLTAAVEAALGGESGGDTGTEEDADTDDAADDEDTDEDDPGAEDD